MVPVGFGPAGFLCLRAEGGSGRKAARGPVQAVRTMCRYTAPEAGLAPRGVAGTMVQQAIEGEEVPQLLAATPLGAADARSCVQMRSSSLPLPRASAPPSLVRTAPCHVTDVESGCSVSQPTPDSRGQTLQKC